MAFKPLTKNQTTTALVEKKTPEQEEQEKSLSNRDLPSIIKTTEERIHIIFDDSGSMSSLVPGTAPPGAIVKKDMWGSSLSGDKSRLELAQEATTDYLRNCKPHVSAVEIAPINAALIPLTKNLPKVASDVKQIADSGGTELYEMLGKLVDSQKKKQFTRALIFTDGQATDMPRNNLINDLQAMKIPIDLIIIGDQTEATLNHSETELKNMVEKTGGTFLICKDGKAFRDKMKYFAPTLRWMLPQIASKDS